MAFIKLTCCFYGVGFEHEADYTSGFIRQMMSLKLTAIWLNYKSFHSDFHAIIK